MKLSILLEALDIKRLTDTLRQIINTCLEKADQTPQGAGAAHPVSRMFLARGFGGGFLRPVRPELRDFHRLLFGGAGHCHGGRVDSIGPGGRDARRRHRLALAHDLGGFSFPAVGGWARLSAV